MQDTVNDPIINARRPLGWSNWQRGEDYYSEGALIWLDVDTKIRELSGDKRSLDDFARAFYGINDGSWAGFYTFEDVVAALTKVQKFDWAPFLRSRLEGHGPGAPLDGLARAGWKLVYTDTPTDYIKGGEERSKSTDFSYSLGFAVRADGGVPTCSGTAWLPRRPGRQHDDRRGQQQGVQAGGAEGGGEGGEGRQGADRAAGQEGQQPAHDFARLPRRPALSAPGTHQRHAGPPGSDLQGTQVKVLQFGSVVCCSHDYRYRH
jgi:hypothetical protein